MYSKCDICGKFRNQGRHTKCSKIRRELYGPDTPEGKLLQAEREARKRHYKILPSLGNNISKKTGFFSKYRSEGNS